MFLAWDVSAYFFAETSATMFLPKRPESSDYRQRSIPEHLEGIAIHFNPLFLKANAQFWNIDTVVDVLNVPNFSLRLVIFFPINCNNFYAWGDVTPLSVKLTMLSLPLRQHCRREGCRELWQSQMGAYPERSFSTFSINLGVLFCKSVLHLMRFSVFVYTGTVTDTARRLCSLQRFGTISSVS